MRTGWEPMSLPRSACASQESSAAATLKCHGLNEPPFYKANLSRVLFSLGAPFHNGRLPQRLSSPARPCMYILIAEKGMYACERERDRSSATFHRRPPQRGVKLLICAEAASRSFLRATGTAFNALLAQRFLTPHFGESG